MNLILIILIALSGISCGSPESGGVGKEEVDTVDVDIPGTGTPDGVPVIGEDEDTGNEVNEEPVTQLTPSEIDRAELNEVFAKYWSITWKAPLSYMADADISLLSSPSRFSWEEGSIAELWFCAKYEVGICNYHRSEATYEFKEFYGGTYLEITLVPIAGSESTNYMLRNSGIANLQPEPTVTWKVYSSNDYNPNDCPAVIKTGRSDIREFCVWNTYQT